LPRVVRRNGLERRTHKERSDQGPWGGFARKMVGKGEKEKLKNQKGYIMREG